jgi:hypothetical protein
MDNQTLDLMAALVALSLQLDYAVASDDPNWTVARVANLLNGIISDARANDR